MIKKVKKKRIGFLKLQLDSFISSFKFFSHKSFWKSAFFDLLTVLLFLLIINVSFSIINNISTSVLPDVANLNILKQSGDKDSFDQAILDSGPALEKSLNYSFSVVFVAFILLIFNLSFFYRRAWCIALDKKSSFRGFWKYFLLNLSWIIVWLILFVVTSKVFILPIAAFVLLFELIILFYSDFVLRSVFDEKKSFKNYFSDWFNISKCFHQFIVFIFAGGILALLLLFIISLFVKIVPLFIILIIVFMVLFIGWCRNYVINLVNNLINDLK